MKRLEAWVVGLLLLWISILGVMILVSIARADNPFCDQAGMRPGPDSPALAENWTPGSGLEAPPWLDIDGKQIEYLGACAPAAPQPSATKPGVASLELIAD